MTRPPPDTSSALLDAILAARALLEPHRATAPALPTAASLPSLLEQARAMHVAAQADADEPVRCLHHFACTGGTLIAKCLAVLPNTQVLSEIDPLSRLGFNRKRSQFAPSDLIRQMHHTPRPPTDETVVTIFLDTLRSVMREYDRTGLRLVLRDHAHSHFCFGPDIPDRPSLGEIVARAFPARSIVTVRHPMDSFLSLSANKWLHFQPASLDEYCRRYLAFLDHYSDLEILRYEDFVADSEAGLARLCEVLDLPFDAMALSVFPAAHLSGDSGRSGGRIAPRARRETADVFLDAARESTHYKALINRLKY